MNEEPPTLTPQSGGTQVQSWLRFVTWIVPSGILLSALATFASCLFS